MIFNSITREINQNQRSRYTANTNPTNQPSYFPQRTYIANSIFQKMPQPTYVQPKKESNLGKMNNKIAENIDYLRYKDQMRSSELRSSRVSYSSNRSNRSNRSNDSRSIKNTANSFIPAKSNGSSHIRSYLPAQKSNIKTFTPQNYEPEQRNITESKNYWKRQSNQAFQNQYKSDEFKYFTRNPITINANSYLEQSKKMATPQRDINQSNLKSVISNKSDDFYDFTNQENQKTNENVMRTQYPRTKNPRDWNASFGDSMKNSKLNAVVDRERTASFEFKQPKQEAVLVEKTNLSPLVNQKQSTSPKPAASKNSIIISAGLIALGLIILLLQIVK